MSHVGITKFLYKYFFLKMQKDKFPPNHNQGIVQHVHMKRDENVKNGECF